MVPKTVVRCKHRRRIELEDNAKVVLSVWRQNPCRTSYFAPQTVELSQSIWNKWLNSAGLFGINGWTQLFVPNRPRQNSYRGTDSVPQTEAMTFALSSNSILLLCLLVSYSKCDLSYQSVVWSFSFSVNTPELIRLFMSDLDP